MSGINLFERQALAERALAERALARNAAMPRETPLAAAMRFIEGADVSQCGKIVAQLSTRLFALEKMHDDMQAANLNEAAHFLADAVLDISAVADMQALPVPAGNAACACGRCDECLAARSDQHYDRKRDAAVR